MSTNQMRLSGILDQENDFRNTKTKQKASADENAHINSKRAAGPLSAHSDIKRARIPLGGKDQNTAIPSLQRSKSLLQSAPKTASQTRLRQPGPALARKPGLQKSNSSLGFTLTKNSLAVYNPPVAAKAKPKSSGKSLPAEDAARPKDLVPRFTTDDLRKPLHTPQPPLGVSLQDTISGQTALLHASHLPAETRHDVDPVKRSRGQLEAVMQRELLLDRLAEEDSVEVVAQRDVPVAPYVPFDDLPLRKEDVEFLHSGRRSRPHAAVPEPEWTDSEEEFADENQRLERELERSGPVGLSAEELNLMLDF